MADTLTYGWLLYRMADGQPDFLGFYQTREKAENDLELLSSAIMDGEWVIASVPFLGWGMVVPGKFSQNGKPSLKIVK